jgi:prephenate dehydrogenase
MFSRVAIVGLGLVGGSIGLALHNAKAAQQVTGYDLSKGITNINVKVLIREKPLDILLSI